MNIEELRTLCHSLPGVTEDIKWGNDLCFLVGQKMFCVTGVEGSFSASLKVLPEESSSLSEREGIIPAPYLARYNWVLVQDGSALTPDEWKYYIIQSHNLVFKNLNKKLQNEISGSKS